ncbi:AI-2E family transporter [Rothia uropygialis]|uniref:AI-2E family transporter n=1 Tax=Kocuria sp. 36 TaxID=1415402 RepID=UPI00101D79BF|nr:AI-2E family transporter [Kocuria sp. 36]
MPGNKRRVRTPVDRAVGRLRSLIGKKGSSTPFPGAKPRPKFELPDVVDLPEDGLQGDSCKLSPAVSEVNQSGLGPSGSAVANGDSRPSPGEYSSADADTSPNRLDPRPDYASAARTPVQFGFLVTVGVGLALLVYYLAVNVGALGGWITGAMFIALGLDPIVRWFESKGLPRILGVAIVLLAFAGIIVLMATVVIPSIARQALGFINGFPQTFDDFLSSRFMEELDEQFGIRDKVENEAGHFFQTAFSDSSLVGNFLNNLINAGSTIAQVVTGTLIVMFLALYFVTSLPSIKAWGIRLAPRSKRARVAELTEKVTQSVGNYVMGQAVVALLNAIFALILMSLVGVPFPLLCAFVVLLLAFIPLVGGVAAGILVTFIALLQGWQSAAVYAICYFAYLQIEAYFISPRIMKKAVAVPGSVAVIAVAGGGALWGVLGAIIAIPVAASALLLVREIFIPRQDRR